MSTFTACNVEHVFEFLRESPVRSVASTPFP